MEDARDVEVQIVTVEQVEAWFTRELESLGLTEDQLNAQAASGGFDNDRARLLWMATPNGIPTG